MHPPPQMSASMAGEGSLTHVQRLLDDKVGDELALVTKNISSRGTPDFLIARPTAGSVPYILAVSM